MTDEPTTPSIKKVDALDPEKPVAGAKFHIWNDEGTFDEEMATDDAGIISLAYAKHGTYHVQEVEAPEGYVIADLDDEGNPTVTDFKVNDQGMVEWDETGAMAAAHEFVIDNMPKTMRTTATDAESGTHEGQAREELTIVDTIQYTGLIPGREYTATGKLMDKATGEPALDDDGSEITASTTFTAEDSCGTVDYLSCRDDVDPDSIGIIGICGWGGMALNAAALDPRIKATVASTMYDMSRVNANGYFDAEDSAKDRDAKRRALAEQRTRDYTEGSYVRAGGVVDPLPADAPQFVKDYYAYYKTPRGYHPRSLNSNDGWNAIGCQSFLNQPILCYANEIANPVLMIHGESAHSLYFGKDAFAKLEGDNKELMVIPGAVHTDLYDNLNCIPFDKLQGFFEKSFAE